MAPTPEHRPDAKPEERAARLRVLSGIQPTADTLHLGNYLGAVKQWVDLQQAREVYYFIADLHAITMDPPTPDELRQRTRVTGAQLLAAGVDPERSVLFVQSQIPAHTQLTWVFECLTGYGEASRMTQFKDKASRSGAQYSVGLLTYPILQAADIVLYQADEVPVGEDQRQHLELTRNVAQRFNSRYGETFVVPNAYIPKQTAKILDLQDPTAKMSKSLADTGTINLLDGADVIMKKFRRAVTDGETQIRFDPETKPGVSNLLTILSAFSGRDVRELVAEFDGQGYGSLKTAVAESVIAFAEPFAKRTTELLDDIGELDRILAEGSARASVVAERTVATALDRVGFLPAPRLG